MLRNKPAGFATTDSLRGGLHFLTRKLSLAAYSNTLNRRTFLESIKVSAARTVAGTPVAVLVASMLACALSHKELAGGKFFSLMLRT